MIKVEIEMLRKALMNKNLTEKEYYGILEVLDEAIARDEIDQFGAKRCPFCGGEADMKHNYTQSQHDPVNSPAHYKQGGIECIDAIKAALGADGFRSFCKGNALKYIWRADHKQDATEDIRKAIWYLNRSIGGEA